MIGQSIPGWTPQRDQWQKIRRRLESRRKSLWVRSGNSISDMTICRSVSYNAGKANSGITFEVSINWSKTLSGSRLKSSQNAVELDESEVLSMDGITGVIGCCMRWENCRGVLLPGVVGKERKLSCWTALICS